MLRRAWNRSQKALGRLILSRHGEVHTISVHFCPAQVDSGRASNPLLRPRAPCQSSRRRMRTAMFSVLVVLAFAVPVLPQEARIENAITNIDKVAARGPFHPTWKSLEIYTVPDFALAQRGSVRACPTLVGAAEVGTASRTPATEKRAASRTPTETTVVGSMREQ